MTSISFITVHELKQLRDTKTQGKDFILLDVRDQNEYDICDLDGVLIPIKELPERLAELDKTKKIITHCLCGPRSVRAAEILLNAGFKDVSVLEGGIKAWAMEIDPKMVIY